MALVTANGAGVVSAVITMPRVGAWHAELVVDSDAGVVGACTLAIDGGLTLNGTAKRAGVWQDTTFVRLVGGAGGLGKTARPQHYRSVSIRTVLQDLARASGELIAATADAAVLATQLVYWTTVAQPVSDVLGRLMADPRVAGAAWRILPDGTLWVGRESWPDARLADVIDYQRIAEAPHEGKAELGFEAPRLLPGQALGARRVSAVEHTVRDGSVRTLAWFED